jgi:hypothetical protein
MVMALYAPTNVDIAKEFAGGLVDTHCREVLLKDTIHFFRNDDAYYKTYNYYAGYERYDGLAIDDFTGTFTRINKTIRKLFNVKVNFSKKLDIASKRVYEGLFFKYTPTEDCYYLTKPTVSAILLMMKNNEVLDYLLNRNTEVVPLDTILLRLLNRTKKCGNNYYQEQLMYAIAYIKFFNTGKDTLINATYYNGVVSYINNIKTITSTVECRKYIQSLIDKIDIPVDYASIQNPF